MTRAPGRAQLLGLGFQDADAGREGLARLAPHAEVLLPWFVRAADPDQALEGLLRLVEAAGDDDCPGDIEGLEYFGPVVVDDEVPPGIPVAKPVSATTAATLVGIGAGAAAVVGSRFRRRKG